MKRKIIFRQGQSPGDILVFTGAIRDLKKSYPDFEIDVRTPCPEIFENNPYLTPLDEKDKGVEIYDIGYPSINESGWRCHHFSDAFREEVQNKLNSRSLNKIRIVKRSILPDLHISNEEKQWTNQVAMTFQYPGRFWIINAGYKEDNPLKQYHAYQEVVRLLKDKVQFVQIGHKCEKCGISEKEGGHPRHVHPELEGVYNLTTS